MVEEHQYHVVVIGAGLTGLSLAHQLVRQGTDFVVLERANRVGGQIRTYRDGHFVYESGPNTGILSTPESVELFEDFPHLLRTARPEAKRRLILKGGRFHPLPSGAKSAFSTTLFTWGDKLRIFAEPFRAKGGDPDESVASLVRRRLGESYFTYAVDPFVGGIYAGDPTKLVTRHALPKLYALEANHGSFIRGAMAVAKRKKSERELKATKEVFTALGGLSSLTDAIGDELKAIDALRLSCLDIRASYSEDKGWEISYTQEGEVHTIRAKHLVTTIGTRELAEVLSPLGENLDPLLAMRYAPVVQVALGYLTAPQIDFDAFGGLVPSIEDSELLGILNPSATFWGRCEEGGLLLSAFLGGMRSPRLIERSDEEIRAIVLERLTRLVGLSKEPDLLHIFRHERAIPQYEASTDERLARIAELERAYPGLHIGGNMLGGIGMSDRIKQGVEIAQSLG